MAAPGIAYAQNIPPVIAALAVSPLFVLLLAVALGVASRSWRVGVAHAGLLVAWILWFAVASYWVENDYVIWTPLALSATHAVILVVLLIRCLLRKPF